eukprot:3129503-Amphidinium_carterae.1
MGFPQPRSQRTGSCMHCGYYSPKLACAEVAASRPSANAARGKREAHAPGAPVAHQVATLVGPCLAVLL